tara:strand:+ start:147 stop:365 length:219 start_codon:yes stop_codon:yes gene_type:complete
MDIDIVDGQINISNDGRMTDHGFVKNDNSLDFGAETPTACVECGSDLYPFTTSTNHYTLYCNNCEIDYGETA